MSAPSPIRISLDRVAATIVDCDPDVRSRLALITIESVRVTPVLITLFAFQGFLPCNAQNTSVTLNSATVTHRIVTSEAFSEWLKMQTWPTFCQFWPVFPEKLVLLLSTRAANVSERILIRNTLCFCKLLFLQPLPLKDGKVPAIARDFSASICMTKLGLFGCSSAPIECCVKRMLGKGNSLELSNLRPNFYTQGRILKWMHFSTTNKTRG